MALPLATTRITVYRLPAADADAEPYQGDVITNRVVVVTGVRAAIGGALQGTVVGREWIAGGEQSRVGFSLRCDPCDLTHNDWVKDEITGMVFHVDWVAKRQGLGLDYFQAQLSIVEGLV